MGELPDETLIDEPAVIAKLDTEPVVTDEVTPITLEWRDGSKAVFMPQSTMTALEGALINQLFVKMIMRAWSVPGSPMLDWPKYLTDHQLWPHFQHLPAPARRAGWGV